MTMLNPAVLQNKGIPIVLYLTEPYVRETPRSRVDEEGKLVTEVAKTVAWRPMTGEDDNLLTSREWLKLDANVLAIIEHRYEGMAGFQEASEKSTSEVIRVVITAVLGLDHTSEDDLAQVGARLIPAQFGFYQNAIMASLSMASGVDPTNAVRLLEEGRLAVKAESTAANEALVKALEEAETERVEAEEKRKAEALEAEAKTQPQVESAETSSGTETDTPGSDGSDSGSASDEPTTSSGD